MTGMPELGRFLVIRRGDAEEKLNELKQSDILSVS